MCLAFDGTMRPGEGGTFGHTKGEKGRKKWTGDGERERVEKREKRRARDERVKGESQRAREPESLA